MGGADASTRGRAVGSLLAGEIADDAAIKRPTAVLRVMRFICFCCGPVDPYQPLAHSAVGCPVGQIWAGGCFGKLVSGREAGSAAGRPVRATISHELGMYAPKTAAPRRKSELASMLQTLASCGKLANAPRRPFCSACALVESVRIYIVTLRLKIRSPNAPEAINYK